jgi:molybdopterin molybdotransferase
MPPGACAVLLQENAMREGDSLSLNGHGDPTPRHIRRKGFDFAKGDQLLAAGRRIGPGELALAISAGNAELQVHVQPSLAILDSGDELSADPTNCAQHQIPASNGAMLAAMATPFVRTVKRLGPVPDRIEAVLQALDNAGDAEVIVTSGGASVGGHDLVRPALEQWGAEIDFWRVAIKPGKPLMVARKGPQWIIGLPGNPVSSFVTAFLFLLPMLRQMAGASFPEPEPISLFTTSVLPATGDRDEFVRAYMDAGHAFILKEQDSSGLHALALAKVLIHRKANAPELPDDSLVEAYLLQNGGIA